MDGIERLKQLLGKLPGVGKRSADRMAVAIARNREGYIEEFAAVLLKVAREVTSCRLCGSLTSTNENPCRLCTDPRRDDRIVCVVEDPGDIDLIERAAIFRGRYFALMGKLAPARGESLAAVRIQQLATRVAAGGVEEVVLALNSDVESDATAHFLAEKLSGTSARITRLARGIPAGGGLAYTDPVTLEAAMKHRTAL